MKRDSVIVREAMEADLPGIRQVLIEALPDPSSEEVDRRLAVVVDALSRAAGRRFFVAELPLGEIAGVAGLQPDGIADELLTRDERSVEVVMVYVRPTHRRRGCGTALLEAVEATAQSLGYTTLLVVSGSRDRIDGYPFWERWCGSPARIDEGYFGTGQEGAVWRKRLAL